MIDSNLILSKDGTVVEGVNDRENIKTIRISDSVITGWKRSEFGKRGYTIRL